ncbi:MAG: M56 family metallopeptidase [Planctomycetaceae bacterium]
MLNLADPVCLGMLMCTYLLHSTLLICLAWLASRWIPTGTRLRSGLWKSAVVLPFMTVGLQLFVPADFNWLNVSWKSSASTTQSHAELATAEVSHERSVPAMALPVVDIAPASVSHQVDVNSELTEFVSRPPVPPLAEVLPNPDEDWGITVRPAPAEVITVLPVDEFDLPDIVPDRTSVGVLPLEAEQPEVMTNNDSPQNTITTLFFWMGLAGFASLLLGASKCLWDAWRIVREIRKSTPLDNLQFANQLRQLRQKYGIQQHVELRSACQCTEPAACGIWKWTILIPDGVAEQLPTEQARALLAHELAHLVRRDTLWLWLGRVLLCCFPWQPLNRLAFGNWRSDEEFLADEWALQRGVQPLALANCLTNVAQWRLNGPACPGVPASSESLTARVMRLLDGQSPQHQWTRAWRTQAFALLLVIAVYTGVIASPRFVSLPDLNHEVLNAVADPLSESRFDELEAEMPPSSFAEPHEFLPAEPEGASELQLEIDALTNDLNVALALISDQYQDPEVSQVVQRLQNRIAALQSRVHSLESFPRETP